jgi:hypothetical protein
MCRLKWNAGECLSVDGEVSELRVYSADELRADGYPLAWATGEPSIKDLIREQAGHRCVRCGHPYRKGEHGKGQWSPCDTGCRHGGPLQGWDDGMTPGAVTAGELVAPHRKIQAEWRILTVHHLTGAKADCRWWNLAALCQRCHLQIQGRVKMAQVYPHEHSEWFRPYAAGYYAATYLGEDLTREQTIERLDELLALERVA